MLLFWILSTASRAFATPYLWHFLMGLIMSSFSFYTGPSCVLVWWLFRHRAFRVDTPSGEVKWSWWRVCIFEKWQCEYCEDKVPSFWHQLIHSKSFYRQFSFLFESFFFPIVHNALSSEIMVVILLRSRQCIFFEVGIFAKYWDAQPSCTVDLALVASFKRWILLYPLHEVDNSILVSLKVVRRIVIYLVDSIIQCLGPIMINIGKHCAFTGKLCS